MGDFAYCIEMLQAGKKMTRAGWNGRGMYIYRVEGRTIPIDNWSDRGCPAQAVTEREKITGFVEILPHIDMYTAQGARLCGWLASQTDMLSNDWEVVE